MTILFATFYSFITRCHVFYLSLSPFFPLILFLHSWFLKIHLWISISKVRRIEEQSSFPFPFSLSLSLWMSLFQPSLKCQVFRVIHPFFFPPIHSFSTKNALHSDESRVEIHANFLRERQTEREIESNRKRRVISRQTLWLDRYVFSHFLFFFFDQKCLFFFLLSFYSLSFLQHFESAVSESSFNHNMVTLFVSGTCYLSTSRRCRNGVGTLEPLT